MADDLLKKAGRGVSWNISAQVAQQIIKLVVLIVLTRLLDPADFGVFAMVLVFTEFIRPFREWGFQAALIQKENIDEEYRSTAFWAIGGVAVLMYLLTCASAPFIGRFFNSYLVGRIIPVMAIVFLMSPFGAVQWALLTRKLNFSAIAMVDTIAVVLYGLAACLLALRGFGVWALILATLISELARSFMFWFIDDWRPLLKFSAVKFRGLLSFAANCTGAGILNYGINNFDNLMVGKFLGAAPLGFYNLAFNTVSQPETRIASQITTVVFPVYSMIKDDKRRIQEAYLNTIKMVAMITVPLVSILFMTTKDFVLVFYGPKWLTAVLPIKIMCLYGLIRALASISSPVFLSQGRPDIELKLTMLRLIVFVGLIFCGIRNGIVGVALAVLAYSLLNFFPTFHLSNRLLGVRPTAFYATILKYIGVCFAIVASLMIVDLLYLQHGLSTPLTRLLLSAAAGLLVYAVILMIFLKADLDYLLGLIKKILYG